MTRPIRGCARCTSRLACLSFTNTAGESGWLLSTTGGVLRREVPVGEAQPGPGRLGERLVGEHDPARTVGHRRGDAAGLLPAADLAEPLHPLAAYPPVLGRS